VWSKWPSMSLLRARLFSLSNLCLWYILLKKFYTHSLPDYTPFHSPSPTWNVHTFLISILFCAYLNCFSVKNVLKRCARKCLISLCPFSFSLGVIHLAIIVKVNFFLAGRVIRDDWVMMSDRINGFYNVSALKMRMKFLFDEKRK
jgi:hypothetical protein